jgi:hypothetical protein
MVNNAVRCELWSLGRLPASVKARPPSRELHFRRAELERASNNTIVSFPRANFLNLVMLLS